MLTEQKQLGQLKSYRLCRTPTLIHCVARQYIGDAIMALWNAPETVIDHPIRACETALLYQSRLAVLQEGMRGGWGCIVVSFVYGRK